MSRACSTCQHLKRAEIDRRLAAGEPAAQLARDYVLTRSGVHRHRVNCLQLAASNALKKEAARGSAAIVLLPSKETLGGAYLKLREQIDQIVAQAQAQGSLSVAISGLNSIRHTLDSLSRLAGHDRAIETQVNVAVQANLKLDPGELAERLIAQLDHKPELKAHVAQALIAIDDIDGGDNSGPGSCPDSGADHLPEIACPRPARPLALPAPVDGVRNGVSAPTAGGREQAAPGLSRSADLNGAPPATGDIPCREPPPGGQP
jgi:hypothetical protein